MGKKNVTSSRNASCRSQSRPPSAKRGAGRFLRLGPTGAPADRGIEGPEPGPNGTAGGHIYFSFEIFCKQGAAGGLGFALGVMFLFYFFGGGIFDSFSGWCRNAGCITVRHSDQSERGAI